MVATCGAAAIPFSKGWREAPGYEAPSKNQVKQTIEK
jgi:hypothetical protein